MAKIGVIIARMQPIHNGHIELIKKSFYENDQTLVFVGSADKINARNPIPINFRIDLVKKALQAEINESLENVDIRVLPLDDLDSEKNNSLTWGFYLYAKIVRAIGQDYFTMYYSDGFEVITQWFTGYILRNHISLSLLARGNTADGVSATKVRDLILSDGNLTGLVPQVVIDNQQTIKAFIQINNK